MNILTSGESGLALYGEGQVKPGQFLTPAAYDLLYKKQIPGHDGATLKDFVPVTFFFKIWEFLLFRLRPITLEEVWAFAWPDKEIDPEKALPGGMEEDTLKLAAFRRSVPLPPLHYKEWIRIRSERLAASDQMLREKGRHTAFGKGWRECLYLPLVWVRVIPNSPDDMTVDFLVTALKKAVEAAKGAPGCIAIGVRECIARNEAMLVGSFFSLKNGAIVAASGAPYNMIRGDDGQPQVVLRNSSRSNLMHFAEDNGMSWLMSREEMTIKRNARFEEERRRLDQGRREQEKADLAKKLSERASGLE